MKQFRYYPILRWKQGEQLAVRRMVVADQVDMLPLAEVQFLEAGVAQPKLKRTLEHARADVTPIGLDVHSAYNGPVPLPDLAKLTATFQNAGLHTWPVVHAIDALLDKPGLASFAKQPALVLRINPIETLQATALSVIADTRKACGGKTALYVVLDIGSIGEIDLKALAGLFEPFVRTITATGEITQVAIAGGSFPYTLGGVKIGVGTRLDRKELDIWKIVRSKPGCTGVGFGDYGVTNPQPLEDIDPRVMNPSASIRYALKNHWWILKASGVRSKGRGGMGQYNDLCKLLIASRDYSGAAFSFGDHQYNGHAQPGASSGSFMTWRRDATSHHLVFTVRQLIAGNV